MEPDSLRATAAKVPLKPKAAWNAHGALIRAATEIERLRACLHGQAGSLAKAYRDVEKWKRAALLADDRRSALAAARDDVLRAAAHYVQVSDANPNGWPGGSDAWIAADLESYEPLRLAVDRLAKLEGM